MMKKAKLHKHVFLLSFFLTVAVFGMGLLLSYGLDFLRVEAVLNTMSSQELGTEAYILQRDFAEFFEADVCLMMHDQLYEIKKETHKVGRDLSNYGSLSSFKQHDFDYLKRKYYLLELRFFSLINELNKKCYTKFIPILFFYEIDDTLSERQGLILDDFGQIEGYKNKIVVLSFDKDYEDEPLLDILLREYNVTAAPTLIIDGKEKREGIMYTGEINASIIKALRYSTDEYAKSMEADFSLSANNVNKSDFLKNLSIHFLQNHSSFSNAESLFMAGRISGNDGMMCESLKYYDASLTDNHEHNALIYETIVTIGCGRNRRAFLMEAAKEWELSGNQFRSDFDRHLAYGLEKTYKFNISEPEQFAVLVPDNHSGIVIGNSKIVMDDSDILVSQADRVNRDWLSYQIFDSPYADSELLTTFSERLTYNDSELQSEIGWHEGARIREIKEANITHIVASSTLVKEYGGKWYAPNERGEFMFEVPKDKLMYPTTRFLKSDTAIIVDTHGVNMLVEQAVRNNASVVIGCCDHPGKVRAAVYLAGKGIKTICFTDKYLPEIIGANLSILGSPPIAHNGSSIILGGRPVHISKNDTIIAMDVAGEKFALSYYKTPKFYFKKLEEFTDLNVIYVSITDFNQMNRIIEQAVKNDARVIGVRIFNSDDYMHVKTWLEKDKDRIAILFHSMSYPYGYKLMDEFPDQTSFDDINVGFE